MAFWTEENETSGLYAAHKTFPFGTELIITNPVSKAQVNVLVGGRPRLDVPDLLVEISKEAAEKLGMPPGYPMWVYIMEAPIVRPASLPAMRPRAGTVTQTGIATVRNTNESVLEAAHPSIAIGSKVKLTNTRTGQNVIVIIRNRILASRERIVEITRGAAGALGITQRGEVRLESVTLQ
ncbi:MAG: septal ring lytic transglycosylase RlpA family protein [Treponema sp.]|nr:septal ring lytic transglycosylase RlpA family protein [Treponema sp.]